MTAIEIYTRPGCGYCTAAKSLLTRKNAAFTELNVATNPALLVLDEPTRGIDVAGKQEIMNLLVKLASEGMALVFISAEVEELLRVSSRIVVMRDRAQVGELPGGCSEDQVYDLIAAPEHG